MNQLNSTKLKLQFYIEPVSNIKYEIGGLLGNSNKVIIQKFYDESICKKLNVIVSELVNNVIENIYDKNSYVELKIAIDAKSLKITVKNKVQKSQYVIVKKKLDEIKKAKDVKTLLVDTIKDRREKKLSGGLGLIRLTSETKAKTTVTYNEKTSYMTINAGLSLKEAK